MRIIFLDVDGVLNCAYTKDRHNGIMGLDERFIKNLKQLVEKSTEREDTRIVLSSSWRAGKDKNGESIPGHLRYLNEKLNSYGMEIYDETPIIRWTKDRKVYSKHRGREISAWLYQHRNDEIKGFVILDDEVSGDFEKYKLDSFLVKSVYKSAEGGFIEPLIEKALKVLDMEVDLNDLFRIKEGL
ncbi:MAG: hypothetical protein K6E56_06160 [Lachnospiraceae bacterium]|nr:hypothetical protein [Lachnospiraceae bacterium]